LTRAGRRRQSVYTTDFRRVYAAVMQGWLGFNNASAVLRGKFEPFPLRVTVRRPILVGGGLVGRQPVPTRAVTVVVSGLLRGAPHISS
jgi:hypothetical protein